MLILLWRYTRFFVFVRNDASTGRVQTSRKWFVARDELLRNSWNVWNANFIAMLLHVGPGTDNVFIVKHIVRVVLLACCFLR